MITNGKIGEHNLDLKDNEEVTAIDICPQDVNIIIAVSKKVPNRLERLLVLTPKEGGKSFHSLAVLNTSGSFFDPVYQVRCDFSVRGQPILTCFELNSKRITNFFLHKGALKYYSK